MADNVVFTDNRVKVNAALKEAAIAFLYEAIGELQSETARNTPVDTGQLKGSWDTQVDESNLEAVIGSPLENAIWNEMGTGEYALNGDGRKGGWAYTDKDGVTHFTHGKKPQRTLHNAYEKLKPKIEKAAEEKFKEVD